MEGIMAGKQIETLRAFRAKTSPVVNCCVRKLHTALLQDLTRCEIKIFFLPYLFKQKESCFKSNKTNVQRKSTQTGDSIISALLPVLNLSAVWCAVYTLRRSVNKVALNRHSFVQIP